MTASSPRSRVDRLRRDLKIAPPPAVTSEKLPARPAKRARAKRAEAPAPAGIAPIDQTPETPVSSQQPSAYQLVHLKQLRRSDLNVRTTDVEEDIQALAADIRAHGVLQNLGVVPNPLGKASYDVVAGGRRLAALHHLQDQGDIDGDYLVPVRIHAAEDGRTTSLAENLHRVAMNPADEYAAYAAIVADHAAEEDPLAYCARRFAVSRTHVEQRLRLADLAPEILDALRANRIGDAAAKAYASYADHDLQLTVFRAEEKRSYGTKHDPRAIRDAMTSKTYSADCVQAVYVGLDAYHAAGGRSERGLFMGQEEGDRLIDPSLLDRLAREKAKDELPAAVTRDGYASGLLAQGFNAYPAWPTAPAGFGRDWKRPADVPVADRGTLIGVYSVVDGQIAAIGQYMPTAPRAQEKPVDYAARRREEVRAERILVHAARHALPPLADTPLGSLASFPEDDLWGAIEPVDEDAGLDGDVYVMVRVLVKAEQIAANKQAAEAEVDAAIAAEQRELEEAESPAEAEPADAA
jgi:ParB family transcriptional regulator, chromosome partitioning protein